MKAETETKKKYRLIIKEIEYDFEDQQPVKFVSYGERHVDNGCLRIIIGEAFDFLFNPEQVGELRDFLEEKEEEDSEEECVEPTLGFNDDDLGCV